MTALIVLLVCLWLPAQAQDRVICPVCDSLGVKSIVWPGISYTTLLYAQPWYDSTGVYHQPADPNITRTEYECSRLHRFVLPPYDPVPSRVDSLGTKSDFRKWMQDRRKQ